MQRISFFLNLILIIPVALWGQSQSPQNYHYELVESVQLTKPAVSLNFLGFNETDKSHSVVVKDKNTLRWLNADKPEINLPQGYLTTVISKTGQYFGIVSLNPASGVDATKQITIDVYSADKDQLYSLEQSKHFDDSLPLIAISDADGSLILGHNFNGKIYFFNPNGELNETVDLFPDAEYDLERVLSFDLDASGSKLAVVAGRRGASPLNSVALHPSAEPQVYLFTTKGEKVWRTNLPEFNTSAVKISGDGKYVVASNYTVDVRGNVKKRSTVLENGDEIFDTDILFKYASFSKDNESLILADNTQAELIDLTSRNVMWRTNVPRKQGMITSIKISENAGIAALLIAKNEFKNGAFIFTKPHLKILDNAGKLQQEISFDKQVFKKPALNLSSDAARIVIGFGDAYQIYQKQF